MVKEIEIGTEFITLGQFLKLINVIQSGGEAKWYLREMAVYVNGEREDRRGRKLKKGDFIRVPSAGSFIIKGHS
ncbi:S4 domain-containing protein YaaA [Fervidibacillus halotolerans]|uniref:S4 domain-containing protein YaaA n=1 Tax=Fervidibacillus halotolerans TaxID=2980027 RepID=A0A9E8RX08_9BACI|nr:S4 domain-containing protein YaaA [Fervidibacillus halotolerans]WAA12300.1 S4 domain-containing protein YaaA [Fervidibacillus halotolerans]